MTYKTFLCLKILALFCHVFFWGSKCSWMFFFNHWNINIPSTSFVGYINSSQPWNEGNPYHGYINRHPYGSGLIVTTAYYLEIMDISTLAHILGFVELVIFFWSLPRSKVYESPLGRICVFFQASYSASPSVKSGSINFRTWSFTALTKESISKNKTGYQHPRYQHDLGCQNGLTRKYWADDHTRSGSSSYTIRGEIAPATHVYTLGHL